MIIIPSDLEHRDRYRLAISAVLPRPIAWVSSMDRAGNLNLAPYSYFTVAASDPLTLLFCPQVSARTGRQKDTFYNIQAVPEFVINLVNEHLAQEMNQTAALLPPGQSEFAWAGVTPAASQTISVPRVKEAPVSFECTLQQIVTVSDRPGGGAVVFGEVHCIHLQDELYLDGQVQLDAYKPIGRLSGSAYVRVTDLFEMQRPGKP
jgi:flavin reductase (DIM6/NTAB) family NADH-FMN oxidoreductase RutF